MNSSRNPPATLAIILVMTISIASCVTPEAPSSGSADRGYPVSWTPEFNMADLLEHSIDVNSQNDLVQLIERPWYASVEIQSPESSESQPLNNCKDYFAVALEKPAAKQVQDSNALLELLVMCEATRLLSEASAAGSSNISPSPLHAQSPNELPKNLALVTSESERSRILRDNTVSSWNDVNPISDVKRISPNRFEYYSDAGVQILSLIGRGDFDSDGVEDILVRNTDSVEGGSYFDIRLFVLTVDKRGSWRVVDGRHPE